MFDSEGTTGFLRQYANEDYMKSPESRNDHEGKKSSQLLPPDSVVQPKTMSPPPFQLKTSLGVESESGESEEQETVQKKESGGPGFADAGADDAAGGGMGGGAGAGGAGGNGLPNDLRAGIESMSGMDMSGVKVHAGSSKPAQMGALAYAQGSDIHLGPGQEQHLPHEAWHVVQQMQGRVQPTMQMKGGMAVNDDAGLEHEADVMGAKAARAGAAVGSANPAQRKIAAGGATQLKKAYPNGSAMQMKHSTGAVQFAGVNVGILGDQAKDLAFEYMGEYWEELKRNFKLEDFLVALVKDLLDIIGVDLVKGAVSAVGQTAAALASSIAQITKVLSLVVKIKEWIDRVPKPIKEFLKYLLGFFMKKVSKWIMGEGMDDAKINTVVFGIANVMDMFGNAIGQLENLLNKLNGLVSSGWNMLQQIPGVQTGINVVTRAFEAYGPDLSAASDKVSGAVGDLWSEAKKLKPQDPKENKATEVDLKFLWLKVKSPEVQKWTEKDKKTGKDKEMGGMVLDSQLGIRLSGNDFEADITVKINYSGDYRFKLQSESVLLENGVGIDGLFNIQGLTLSQLEMSSEEGLALLIVKLARIAFGNDVLVGENLKFQYKKGSKTPFELDGGVELNALGRSLNGNLHLGFKDDGKLGRGKFAVTTGKEKFELIKDHLSIENINAEGDWNEGKFDSLMIKGDPALNFSGARVSGKQVGLEYHDGKGFEGKADSLLIEVDIMGATVGVYINNATIEENGFSADDVTLKFTGAAAKKEAAQQPTQEGGQEEKVGLVKEFVPAFELDWLTKALGIEEVEMRISNARIGWGKKKEGEQEGSETQTEATGQEAEGAGPKVAATKTTLAPVKPDEKPDEKTNVFTLRRLKATLFGITVDGAYKDETKTFEGTISSKLFGQDSGRKPATFGVQMQEGGNWEATIKSLALLPENKAIGEALNVGPIVLNKITFGSADGIKEMELAVDKFGVAGDILAAEGILLNYTKDKGILEANASIYLKLMQEDPRLSGKLNLQFAMDGTLIKGSAIKEPAGEQFPFLGNRLILSNPNFNAQFSSKEGLSHLMANGNLSLQLPSAKVSADNATFEFDKAEKIFKAHVDTMTGKVLLGEDTLVMVVVQGAQIDKKGISAESIKLTFSYGDEEAPKEDLKALAQAGDLGKLLPGFNADMFKSVGGIDTFVMDLTTTNVNYSFGGEGEEDQVKKAAEDSEKKSETSLAIRKLKAHAFGFEIMGKYSEGLFEGSFNSPDFGGGEFDVNTTDPEKWVARAHDVDLKFGGRKLFNLFGMERVQLHELQYVSGQGINILNLSVHKLDFGNGVFLTDQIDGQLTEKGLEFAGKGVQLDVFGYKLAGAFKVSVDKSGKPTEIRATLDGATDIDAIANVLKFTGVGGSVDWVNGALENMELHAGMGLNLPAGISLDVPKAQFGYKKEDGLFAAVDEMRLGVRISSDTQLLFRMLKGRVAKDEAGKVNFTAERMAATFAYGKEIISPEKDVKKEELQTLLPGMPTKWLDFAGMRVLVFTAAANQVKVGPKGLEIGSWEKVVEALEGGFMGLDVGYNSANAEIGLGQGLGGMVEGQLDKYTTGGQGNKEGLDKNGGKDSTGKKPEGPGGWVRGSWNKEVGIPAIGLDIPILPGLAVGGGISAGVGVGATVGAGLEKLPGKEDGKERFKISGDAAIKAFGDLKVELHATVGHELIIAIQAGLYAKASIAAAAEGMVTGVILWDREENKMSISKRQEDKPQVDVKLSAGLHASVGAEVKLKAFVFFEKKLWSYEFKKWDLGEWLLHGKLMANDKGGYEFIRESSGFGKDGGLPTSNPDVDAKVVTPLDVLQKGEKIDDQRVVWRIYHDIMDPTSGYSPEQQEQMVATLKSLTKIDFSKQEGDFGDMMSGMRERTQGQDPSGIMGDKEWEAYSSTESTFLFWTSKTKRKAVKAVDIKLAEYNKAKTNADKIKVLQGTLSKDDITKKLPKIDLDDPTDGKYAPIFQAAGLIQVCDTFILKESGSSRVEMVGKLRNDAARELQKLLKDPGERRRMA
jgi:hypothetical protein